ncbi:ArgE/DapE family deacylase [bacterium]|nr:ArgE/DapE family deacylase [bacterium]
MTWKTELEAWYAAHHDEGVALLAALVRENTVNPPGNEARAVRVVREYLGRYGIEAAVHEAAPGRASLLARVGSGSPVLFVPAHTDVVPAGDGWEHDAFDPVVRDGCLYGRGSADNKGPLVSLLLLAAFLKSTARPFTGTLLVGAVADEEAGSAMGLTYLLEQGLVNADYAIVPDTGESVFRVSCGEKGLLHFDVTFHGTQAHGSSPERGMNAIWAAHDFLGRVRKLFGRTHGYIRQGTHALFTPTTVNIAKISAGAAYNMIPGQCVIGIDVRYVPGQTRGGILELFERAAAETHAAGLCTRYDIRVDTHMEPFVVERESELIRAVAAAVKAVTRRRITCFGLSGTTVCKQLVSRGIPAIGFSQDSLGQAHMANEHLRLSEIPLFGAALGMAFLALGGNR